jgi:hypothetical protein
VNEYVNRVEQNIVAKLRRKSAVHDQDRRVR